VGFKEVSGAIQSKTYFYRSENKKRRRGRGRERWEIVSTIVCAAPKTTVPQYMGNKRYIYPDTDTVSICALFDNTRMPHRPTQIQIPSTYGSNKHIARQEMGLKTENWGLEPAT